jgi:hypothetical protein
LGAYAADFIRNARSGGCGGGKPPANLGFRLVRERETRSVAEWRVAGLPRLADR